MARVITALLLLVWVAQAHAGAPPVPDEFMVIELRVEPKHPGDQVAPAPTRLKVKRTEALSPGKPDPDGIHRLAGIMLRTPQLIGVKLVSEGWTEHERARLRPRPDLVSPLAGMKSFQNNDPTLDFLETFAVEDETLGLVIATCVKNSDVLPKSKPGFTCSLQSLLPPNLVFATALDSAELGNWKPSMLRARDYISAALQ
jgi:hypothetical protein